MRKRENDNRQKALYYPDYNFVTDEVPEEQKPPVNTIYYSRELVSGIPQKTKKLALDGYELEPGELLENPTANDVRMIVRDGMTQYTGILWDFDLFSNYKRELRPGQSLKRLREEPKQIGGFTTVSVDDAHFIIYDRDQTVILYPESAEILTGVSRVLEASLYNRDNLSWSLLNPHGDVVEKGAFIIQRSISERLAIILHRKSGIRVGVCNLYDSGTITNSISEAMSLVNLFNEVGYDPSLPLKRIYKTKAGRPKKKTQAEIELDEWVKRVDKVIFSVDTRNTAR